MSRTIIDIDDSALAAAMRELGTKTKVETVNKALADVGALSGSLFWTISPPQRTTSPTTL